MLQISDIEWCSSSGPCVDVQVCFALVYGFLWMYRALLYMCRALLRIDRALYKRNSDELTWLIHMCAMTRSIYIHVCMCMCHDSINVPWLNHLCHDSINVPWLNQCAMTRSIYIHVYICMCHDLTNEPWLDQCAMTQSMCHDSIHIYTCVYMNVPWLNHTRANSSVKVLAKTCTLQHTLQHTATHSLPHRISTGAPQRRSICIHLYIWMCHDSIIPEPIVRSRCLQKSCNVISCPFSVGGSRRSSFRISLGCLYYVYIHTYK